ICEVVAITTIHHLLEVVARRENDETFGPGITLELDVQHSANIASATICSDQIVPVNLSSTIARLDDRGRRSIFLTNCNYACIELLLRIAVFAKLFDAHIGELVLFCLNDERKLRLVTQQLVIEFCNLCARRTVPKLEVARH